MSIHVSTTTTFEVDVDLSGSYAPGYASTRDDPGHDGEVEEADVKGVFALRSVKKPDGYGGWTWDRFDILKGLDKTARAQIAANILAFIGEEADRLIFDEAHNV